MMAFLYEIWIHWKLNVRSKEFLVHFYIVPFIFYLFIGGIFTAINPEAYRTLIPAMTVFGVTMGGVLGFPYSLVEFYGSENKKAYQAAHIPLWTAAAGNFLSSMLNLFLMSMLIFATAPLLFHAPLPQNPANYFITLILLIAASLGIGMVFGLFLKSASKLGMAAQLVFLPSVMLSGIMFSPAFLPGFLQSLGKLLPATWGYEAMCESEIRAGKLIPLLLIITGAALLSIWKLQRIKKNKG